MDPLSRKLNGPYPKVEVKMDNEVYTTNHLLFIDDLKFFSKSGKTLFKIKEDVKKFFNDVGLEINRSKSATNSKICEENAVVLNADEGYKYLGIIENRESKFSKEIYSKIKNEILKRIGLICKTKLNEKKLN